MINSVVIVTLQKQEKNAKLMSKKITGTKNGASPRKASYFLILIRRKMRIK